jgi:methylisocitrate lyase
MQQSSAGSRFKEALKQENPLQIAGTINACTALLAKQAGFNALYLSGAGLCNAALGLPDLGFSTFTEVAEEIRRITSCVDLPLLVDGDTGFGSTLTLQRMIREFERAGAAAVHLEDQRFPKRCGHRPGKTMISTAGMLERIKVAVDARQDPNFMIMARTDALAEETLDAVVARTVEYQQAGADLIFLEAVTKLDDYIPFVKALSVPVLANITEFGKTPLFTLTELKSVGIQMVLYPLSAFRAMNYAALQVYKTIKEQGTQKEMLAKMQTREELYALIDYYRYESQLDESKLD